MSKNTKHKNYKAYLRLLAEEDKLEEIKRNLGYRELEKPVHHGYEAFFVLRDDIARRADAYVFQHLIDNYTTTTWSKTKEFYIKKKRYHIDNRPTFTTISERQYTNLDLRVKKYFFHDKEYPRWDGTIMRWFCCGIPPYYLVMKIRKSYLTHERVIDSELERQLNFVGDKLSQMREVMPLYNNRGLTGFRKGLVKSDRAHNRQQMRKNLKTQILSEDGVWEDWAKSSAMNADPYELKYKHRNNAAWLWW